MKNYFDPKCTYRYITLCDTCKHHAPRHVKIDMVVYGFPAPQCEMCKRANPHTHGQHHCIELLIQTLGEPSYWFERPLNEGVLVVFWWENGCRVEVWPLPTHEGAWAYAIQLDLAEHYKTEPCSLFLLEQELGFPSQSIEDGLRCLAEKQIIDGDLARILDDCTPRMLYEFIRDSESVTVDTLFDHMLCNVSEYFWMTSGLTVADYQIHMTDSGFCPSDEGTPIDQDLADLIVSHIYTEIEAHSTSHEEREVLIDKTPDDLLPLAQTIITRLWAEKELTTCLPTV